MSTRNLNSLTMRLLMAILFPVSLLVGSLGAVNRAVADQHKVLPAGALQCTDDLDVQLVQILMEDFGENLWTNCIEFAFFDSGGTPTGSFIVGNDPPSGANAVVGIGSQQLASTPGAPPVHITIPAAQANAMVPGGQVCYRGLLANTHPSGARCRDPLVCQPIAPATCGCDGVPNSGLVVDECGLCGGDGSTCASACGDVSGDGSVTIFDALMIAQFDVGLRTCSQLPAPDSCDINPIGSPDGACNIGDALRAAQCDVGLIPCNFACVPTPCPVP